MAPCMSSAVVIVMFLLLASSYCAFAQELDREPETQDVPTLQARVEALRKLLKDGGGSVDHYLQLALTLQQLNHIKPDGGTRVLEAERAYRKALQGVGSNAPVAVRVRGNMGALLLEAGRAQEALSEFETALLQARESGMPLVHIPGTLFNRAKALSLLGDLTGAQTAYMETAQLAHGKDLVSFSKAVAAMEQLPDELLEPTEEAVRQANVVYRNKQGPQQRDLLAFIFGDAAAEAGAERSGHADGRGDGEDDDNGDHDILDDMGALQAGGGGGDTEWLKDVTVTELAWLGFALHKAHDRRKNIDKAWFHLERANRLMRTTMGYSIEHDVKAMDQIKSVFSGSFGGGTGFADSTPVFVVGLPRSGSTLVETMFASHSDVWPAGEDTALAPLTAEVNRRLNEPGVDHLKLLEEMGMKYITQMLGLVPPDWDGSGQKTNKRRPSRIVDKMLRNLWLVGYIHLMLPKACVLHVARHPMDAGLSCYQQPFGYSGLPWAWDQVEIAAQINMTWDLQRHWDTVLPGRIKLVLYEELVSFQEQVTRELLEHCGMTWQPEVLEFHTTSRVVATASVAQVRKPLYNSSMGRWKRYERHLEPMRRALGGTVDLYESRLRNVLEVREARRQRESNPVKDDGLDLSWWTPEPDDSWRDEF